MVTREPGSLSLEGNTPMQDVHDSLRMLKILEVCQLLGISRATLYRIMESGQLPYHRVTTGGARRVSVGDLKQYLQKRAVASSTTRNTVTKSQALFEDAYLSG